MSTNASADMVIGGTSGAFLSLDLLLDLACLTAATTASNALVRSSIAFRSTVLRSVLDVGGRC